ncbi:hypothetical protein ACQKP8_26245 [Photobacterium alginatilyticum]|uniref:hypothetical protein n=1 Tax=Photobacterium alginatilyticum TaxID=1775171 RepID=UPI0040683922
MDSKVLAALIGLVGISLGAFLSGLGFYLKSRAERLETKRNVLFHLLEIRHLVKTSFLDSHKITQEYLTYCLDYFEKIGLGKMGAMPDGINSLIDEHLNNLLSAMKPNIDASFISSYENAIKQLSKNDPVLAYKLSGREKLNQVLNSQDEYLNNLSGLESIQNIPNVSSFISKQADKAQDAAIKELLNDLDKDIHNVSLGCGLLTWWSCKKIMEKKEQPSINFSELGFDNIMEQMVLLAVEHEKESMSVK